MEGKFAYLKCTNLMVSEVASSLPVFSAHSSKLRAPRTVSGVLNVPRVHTHAFLTPVPIQAIGLSLYEELPNTTVEQVGTEVIRTQWLDFSTLGEKSLVGKRVLIVDEVDDTRKTLGYAVKELQKDVEEQYKSLPADAPPTEFAIFVVHNKLKEKASEIPSNVKYFPGAEIDDLWVDYPWEQQDIVEHTRLAEEDKKKVGDVSRE